MTVLERVKWSVYVIALLVLLTSSFASGESQENNLAEWLKGVWISGQGTYTIYTDSHYFVVSFEGDTSASNIYCGASQLEFHNRGVARKQVIRLRQFPGREPTSFREAIFTSREKETKLEIDTTLFSPGVCNIKEGIIYDSVTEVTDEYILLATCNGDHIKVFANGVFVYLPAAGGGFYSYRVERF